MIAPLSASGCRGRFWRLLWTAPLLAGVLLSCGQPHPSNNEAASAAPPAAAYEAHVVAGDVPPPGGSLRNPHNGDAGVARGGAMLFNAMTRRAAFGARMRRCRAKSSATVALETDSTLFLALAPLTLRAPWMQETLAELDAVHLSLDRHPRGEVSIEGTALDFWLIEISAAAA